MIAFFLEPKTSYQFVFRFDKFFSSHALTNRILYSLLFSKGKHLPSIGPGNPAPFAPGHHHSVSHCSSTERKIEDTLLCRVPIFLPPTTAAFCACCESKSFLFRQKAK